MINDVDGGKVIPTSILLPDGRKLAAEFHVWERDPANPSDPTKVQLGLHFGTTKITIVATDYFAAMVTIRIVLEVNRLLLNCYGASRNVQPSPMNLLVDAGEQVFRLKLGEQAQITSLVSIFDTGADVEPVTVAAQNAFFEEWTRSISR